MSTIRLQVATASNSKHARQLNNLKPEQKLAALNNMQQWVNTSPNRQLRRLMKGKNK